MGLHEYLTDFLSRTGQLGAEINSGFFTVATAPALSRLSCRAPAGSTLDPSALMRRDRRPGHRDQARSGAPSRHPPWRALPAWGALRHRCRRSYDAQLHRITPSPLMTYCVAMRLDSGILFASDSRTNAGVDHIASFCKMRVFELQNERVLVVLSSGNLCRHAERDQHPRAAPPRRPGRADHLERGHHVRRGLFWSATRCAKCSGATDPIMQQGNIDDSASLLVGGQLKGEEPRLFISTRKATLSRRRPRRSISSSARASTASPILDRVVGTATNPGGRRQVHSGLLRLHHPQQHLGGAADRSAVVLARLPAGGNSQKRVRRGRSLLQHAAPRPGAGACAGCSRNLPIPTGCPAVTDPELHYAKTHRPRRIDTRIRFQYLL